MCQVDQRDQPLPSIYIFGGALMARGYWASSTANPDDHRPRGTIPTLKTHPFCSFIHLAPQKSIYILGIGTSRINHQMTKPSQIDYPSIKLARLPPPFTVTTAGGTRGLRGPFFLGKHGNTEGDSRSPTGPSESCSIFTHHIDNGYL